MVGIFRVQAMSLFLFTVYMFPVSLFKGKIFHSLRFTCPKIIQNCHSLLAPIGVVDQSLMKDFPDAAGEISAYGPGVVSIAVVQDGDGRREVRSPAKAPHLQLIEGKV